MGCCGSVPTDEQWEENVAKLELDVLNELGWKQGEYQIKFTNIQVSGNFCDAHPMGESPDVPFRVRTFYFGCEDKSKKTLILTHGYMQNALCNMGFLKLLAQEYRVIAYDNCNWGLNTRTTMRDMPKTPEAAEKWILDFHTQAINSFDDVPEKFFLAGHSHGGYQVSLYASQNPERVDGLFLISPAGTQGYDEKTYDPYNSFNMFDAPWRRYTKKEMDEMKNAFTSGKHVFHQIHSQPNCLQNIIWGKIADGVDPVFKAAKEPPKAIVAYKKYWAECFKRHGMLDYA